MTHLESSGNQYIFVHRIDKESPFGNRTPLHMTALHWLESEATPHVVADRLHETLQSTRPITTRATREDMFGPDHDIPVMRLERTPELLGLHLALLGLAQNIKGKLDIRWVGEEKWNPHVTHTPEMRLYDGDEVCIRDIDFIIGRPDRSRELVATVVLDDDQMSRTTTR